MSKKDRNDLVIKRLENDCDIFEKGVSSHWVEHLEGFEYQNGHFTGKGLPDGRGGDDQSVFHEVIHRLFLVPFRLQGRRLAKYKDIVKIAEYCHKNRETSMRLGTLRQVMTLAFLEEKIDVSRITAPMVVIGDGFGIMASILLLRTASLDIYKSSKVVVVNIVKNLLVDAVYIKKSVPDVEFALVENDEEYGDALQNDNINCILIKADDAEVISNQSIGILINICSMQEMNPDIIGLYFDYIRNSSSPDTYFYCANRVHKVLPDGTIVDFVDYPWHPKDQILIDELCPWHQIYYSPRRFPFFFRYNGPIQHRLIKCFK